MIPGFLIALVTFPGVIVHEMAHQFFCRLARVAVFDVCYFRLGNPSGYVQHEPPRKIYQSVLISIGPFLVNTIVGALIACPSILPVMQFEGGSPLDYVLVWLGLSISMHAFPSTGDANSLWKSVTGAGASFLVKVLVAPIVLIIYLGALGSVFWLDLIFGVGVCMALPWLLVHAVA